MDNPEDIEMEEMSTASSGSAEPEPNADVTWTDIPVSFKLQMAKYLDTSSTHDFFLSSKEHKEIVEHNPFSLQKLKITARPKRLFKRTQFNCQKTQKTSKTETSTESNSMKLETEQAAAFFLGTFRNRDTVVDQVWLEYSEKCPKGMNKLMTHIFESIDKKKVEGYSTQCKVKQLSWAGPVQNCALPEIVQYLDPEYLHTLYIKSNHIHREEMEKLIGLPQWENLKEIRISSTVDLDLEGFYQFAKMEICVPVLDPTEFSAFLTNFLTVNTITMSYFWITTKHPMDSEFKNKVVEIFGPQGMADGGKETFDFLTASPVRKFKLPNDKLNMIIVNFGKNTVHGMVASQSTVNNAYVSFLVQMNLQLTKVWEF